jgi:hypothetical protein
MTMVTAPEPDLAANAEQLLATTTSELGLRGRDMPDSVREATDDYATAIGDAIEAGRQLERDLAELHGKADLIPGEGLLRLRHEALNEARNRTHEADRRAEQALATLEERLTDAAMPKVDERREALARDELQLAWARRRLGRSSAALPK